MKLVLRETPNPNGTWNHSLQLGGSWVDMSGIISRVTRHTTHTKGLIPLLITTHEPPRKKPGGRSGPKICTLSLVLGMTLTCPWNFDYEATLNSKPSSLGLEGGL